MRATAAGWATQPPSRRKGRRPTRRKMAAGYLLCGLSRLASGLSGLFESVWGRQAFRDRVAARCGTVCARPGPPPAGAPCRFISAHSIAAGPAPLSIRMAQSIAGYEASAEVTSFTSKFDAVLAGKAQFTTQSRAATTCSAARRNATPVIVTAAWRGPAVHRLHGQQYRNPCQSAASLLRGKSARRTGLCRQSGRVIVHRWRRRQFSHQGQLLSQPSAVEPLCCPGTVRNSGRRHWRLWTSWPLIRGGLAEQFPWVRKLPTPPSMNDDPAGLAA